MRSLVLLTLATLSGLFAQPGEQLLAPQSTISENAAGSEERIYQLHMPAGKTLEVSVREIQGMAGILAVLGPSGNEIAVVDLNKRTPSAKRVLVGPGDFHLRVTPATHSSLPRVFEITGGRSGRSRTTISCASPHSS